MHNSSFTHFVKLRAVAATSAEARAEEADHETTAQAQEDKAA